MNVTKMREKLKGIYIYFMRWDGLVSIVTEVWARRPKYHSSIRERVKRFFLSSPKRPEGLWGPRNLLFDWSWGRFILV